MLKEGNIHLDLKNKHSNKLYRMYIFHYSYDDKLPHYYNNNQRFLQKNLDEDIIKKTKIFEKEEIRWISIDEVRNMKSSFRSYFQSMVNKILVNENKIKRFLVNKSSTRKTRKNKK